MSKINCFYKEAANNKLVLFAKGQIILTKENPSTATWPFFEKYFAAR